MACTFDLWLVLVNLLAAAVFIKFMVAIKHAVFISSLILFALAYLLLFLHDLLYTMAVILLYLLFSINAIGQLAASSLFLCGIIYAALIPLH